MRFLVSAPLSSDKADKSVQTGQVDQSESEYASVAVGAGLDWKVVKMNLHMLHIEAKQSVRYENVELKTLSIGQTATPQSKDTLVYNVQGKERLWIDTKPYAPSRFITDLAVVVQEIKSASGNTLGYVVAFPDGRVLRVVVAELLKYCETARAQGRHAVQNMQYVAANNNSVAHLKNYEGHTIPVYIHQRQVVNAEKVTEVQQPVKQPVPVESKATSVFSNAQLEVLGEGRSEGVEYALYANPKFSPEYMKAVLRVLSAGKSAALLLEVKDGSPVLSDTMASFYSYELMQGMDIKPYFNKSYSRKQATQVKLGVIRGLDISAYASPDIDGDEMEQRRVRMDADMWSGINPA